MNVRYLKLLLEGFDDQDEVLIEIVFDDLGDWPVLDGAYSWAVEPESGGLVLRSRVYGGDFDYPDVLKAIKDLASAIPEWACEPERHW